MTKKIIVFDMDGVLFDTIGFARESFIKRRPGMTKEMYDDLHSSNYHNEARKYDHLKIPITEEEEKKYIEEYSIKKSEATMFEGMKELLLELHAKGSALVLNTNAYEINCLPLLENAGIKDIFDYIACAEVSKDKVEKFGIIEKKFDAAKTDIIFVTDALGDAKDAEQAGVSTIAVTFGVHNRSYFEEGKLPNLLGIVNSPGELKELLHTLMM